MFRKIVTPQNTQLLLQIPQEFVGQKVEIIAFTVEEENKIQSVYSWENAQQFFRKNAVDFSHIEKWKREDLYE